MANVEWHGDEAKAMLHQLMAKALTRAAVVVARRAKELLSVPGTAHAIKKFTYSYGGEKRTVGKRGRVYGAVVSEPGEPPRKQYGRLRASVAYEVDEASLTARVGTNVKYGLFLELGTKRGLAPRPWLRRAAAESRARINAEFARGGRD